MRHIVLFDAAGTVFKREDKCDVREIMKKGINKTCTKEK